MNIYTWVKWKIHEYGFSSLVDAHGIFQPFKEFGKTFPLDQILVWCNIVLLTRAESGLLIN